MTKKYKHKKNGATAVEHHNFATNGLYDITLPLDGTSMSVLNMMGKEFIEDSCDWEEIKEIYPKDYEILSYKNMFGSIYHKQSSGLFQPQDSNGDPSKSYDPLKEDKLSNATIYSVKRLRDSSIFTIDDEIKTSIGTVGRIVSFDPNNGRMGIYINPSRIFAMLEEVERRLVIHTTHDGVDVFDDFQKLLLVDHLFIFRGSVVCDLLRRSFIPTGSKSFSTEEAARKYILMNKPLLSVTEVLTTIENTTRGWYENSIISLAKSKLQIK